MNHSSDTFALPQDSPACPSPPFILKSQNTGLLEGCGSVFTSYAALRVLDVFTWEQFKRYGLQIKRWEHQCEVTGRAMNEVTLDMPNLLDIYRLYSVPCGQRLNDVPCQSWIFLDVPTESYDSDGECLDAVEWINAELGRLRWCRIRGSTQERFLCPNCWTCY